MIKRARAALVRIEKGAIGYANVELMVYNASAGSYTDVTEFRTGGEYREFEFDITSIYGNPAGNLVLEETLKELKGKVLSFYYPWYTSPHGPSGRWVGWEQVTEYSIHNSANYPLHGAYDSNDENVIRSHMAIAKQAGIDGFIVSWWGIRSYEEKPVDKILELAEQMDLNITLYYESVRTLTKSDIVNEFTYIIRSYADHPAFLKLSGKPVIFVYAVPVYERGPHFWLDVRSQVEENVGPVVLIGDTDLEEYLHVFDGFHRYIYLEEDMPGFYRDCVDKFEVGVSSMEIDDLFSAVYLGEEIEMSVKPFLLTVTPGFDTTSWGEYEPYVDRFDGETYTKYWDMVKEIGPHSVLITSWNEWGEGTEVEPSREYGFDYITMTRYFVEEYKKTSIPIYEADFSAAVGSLTQRPDLTGNGSIVLATAETPALYVNVSISGEKGVSSLVLQEDFYSYVNRKSDTYASILIPSIPSHDELDVRVVYKAETFSPRFNISVTAFDPSGRFYELYNGQLRPVVLSSITGSLSSESIEIGESITVSGSLNPENEGRTITLSYTNPDSSTLTRTVTTAVDGSYSDTYEPDVAGSWSVRASWEGDVDFEGSTSSVIHLTVTKTHSSLSIQTSESKITEGDSIKVSGSIDPTISGAGVIITFKKPDGSTFTRTVTTGLDSSYSDSLTPTETGSWNVEASWEGDAIHEASTSQQVIFTVEEKVPIEEEEEEKKGCIIATATYGSELSPEVQFLRGFRDNTVLTTFAGMNFMTVFNTWYYSFSPSVASIIAGNNLMRGFMKILLYPLIGILHFSATTNSLFSFNPELAVIVSGMVASSLLGATYFAPIVLILCLVKNVKIPTKVLRAQSLIWVVGVGFITIAEIIQWSGLMMFSTAMFVLITMSLAILSSVRYVKKLTYARARVRRDILGDCL